MNRRRPIVTIDGPAGSGKSTVARALARAGGLPYLNTGLLYRAIAWLARERGVEPSDGPALAQFLDAVRLDVVAGGDGLAVVADGRPVDAAVLGRDDVGAAASRFAALAPVRARLLDTQRRAAGPQGIVVDGRDMGSVVFPDADLKVFLDAPADERARRRALELGRDPGDAAVLRELQQRDARDSGRDVAPLVVPPGARVIDTSGRDVGDIVRELLAYLV